MSRRNRSGLAALGVPARGGAIYDLALTHRSFAFEQPEPTEHNERLELLGDAVVGLVVAGLVYRTFPDLPEGELARLRASVVNTHALADLSRELELGQHLRLGKGEGASGGADKESLLADLFEAIVGAVYVDRGMNVVQKALEPLFAARIELVEEQGSGHDAKTILQEAVVKDRGARPTYKVASSGPDHDKRFRARVYSGRELLGSGTGRSKKEAEQAAARAALDRFVDEGGTDARAS